MRTCNTKSCYLYPRVGFSFVGLRFAESVHTMKISFVMEAQLFDVSSHWQYSIETCVCLLSPDMKLSCVN